MAEFVKKDGTVIAAALERCKPAISIPGFINGCDTEMNYLTMTSRIKLEVVVHLDSRDETINQLKKIIHPGALIRISSI